MIRLVKPHHFGFQDWVYGVVWCGLPMRWQERYQIHESVSGYSRGLPPLDMKESPCWSMSWATVAKSQ